MRFTRRRFIAISAAAAGLPLLAIAPSAGSQETASALRTWRGVALGADAMLQFHHPDAREADHLIQRSLAEVHRLERIFSLYREDSEITRLNTHGHLDDPPQDLLRILSESEDFSRATGGAFDITVQPLWDLYARHFSAHPADESGPAAELISAALGCVGHDGLDCGTSDFGGEGWRSL